MLSERIQTQKLEAVVKWLLNPKGQVEKAKEMKEEGKKNKGKGWEDYTDEYNS